MLYLCILKIQRLVHDLIYHHAWRSGKTDSSSTPTQSESKLVFSQKNQSLSKFWATLIGFLLFISSFLVLINIINGSELLPNMISLSDMILLFVFVFFFPCLDFVTCATIPRQRVLNCWLDFGAMGIWAANLTWFCYWIANFFIFNLSRFCKNIWSGTNLVKIYIWRRGPRRQVPPGAGP
jgi:hypothetical protein